MKRGLGTIALIYKDHIPPMDLGKSGTPGEELQIRYIAEDRMLEADAKRYTEVGLVIYQLMGQPRLSREQIQKSFPGATIITCSPGPEADAAPAWPGRSYSLIHLTEPIDGAQVVELLRAGAAAAPSRPEPASLLFEGALSQFSQLFIHLVEVSTSKDEFALVFGELIRLIAHRLNAEHCFFYLYSESEGQFFRGFLPPSGINQIRSESLFSNVILEEVINKGGAFVSNTFEGKRLNSADQPIQVYSVLYYPLIKNSKRIGVLEVVNKLNPDGFGEKDKEFLGEIRHTLAVLVDNAILFQNVERLCYTDDLTKLYNSRYLKQFLVTEVKRSLRYKKKVSLLFIDIDHFKSVNDRHGHLVGSETLVEIGRVIKAAVRDTDVVVRYGGDEFVVVLPEVGIERATEVGERIRTKVENHRFGAKQNLAIQITASVGISTCPEHAMTAEGLIQKADMAMYQAKGFSKNTVCVAL